MNDGSITLFGKKLSERFPSISTPHVPVSMGTLASTRAMLWSILILLSESFLIEWHYNNSLMTDNEAGLMKAPPWLFTMPPHLNCLPRLPATSADFYCDGVWVLTNVSNDLQLVVSSCKCSANENVSFTRNEFICLKVLYLHSGSAYVQFCKTSVIISSSAKCIILNTVLLQCTPSFKYAQHLNKCSEKVSYLTRTYFSVPPVLNIPIIWTIFRKIIILNTMFNPVLLQCALCFKCAQHLNRL
jgi:hypothetical protein